MSCLNSLIVSVERGISNSRSLFFRVFEQYLDIDLSISIPFEQITNTFRFLYGIDVYISFIINSLILKNK